MNFLEFVFLVLVVSALYRAAPQGQQCLNCEGKACNKDPPRTRYCSEKCSTFVMLGRGDEPDYDNPYIKRGCSNDNYLRRFGCVNKCYDKKRRVGSDKYFVCVYCCTGGKCNKASIPGIDAGLQLSGGVVTTMMSAGLSLTVAYLSLS